MESSSQPSPNLPVPADGRDPAARANGLAYPVSTLGPSIVPLDLSTFRTRGVSEIEKRLRQELVELHEEYVRALDRFHWNRLVYSADFRFEPVMGETYHLYRDAGRFVLSLVGPEEWAREFIGSFRLNIDRCWEPMRLADGVRAEELFACPR